MTRRSQRNRRPQGRRPNRRKAGRSNGFNADSDRASIAPFRGASAKADTIWYQPVFQQSKRVTLRYVETALSCTGTTGAVGGYVFSANGLFDPNITGTGHQPMGFDQMMLLFEQATVLSSKASFTVYNGSAANISMGVALYLSPDTTILSNFGRTVEAGNCNYRLLAPINTPGNFVQDLNMSCDVRRYFGRTRQKRGLLNDDDLFTTSAANPVEQVYFILSAEDIISGANTVVADFTVNIEYDVVFWEPRKLTQS
jgi:hypothetical protein